MLVSKALIDFSITHDDFDLLNNVLKAGGDRKKEIRDLKTETVNRRF